MKHKSNLKYVFKIHSSRLRKAKWNLNLTIDEAIENEEIITLADSMALRFIADIRNKKNNTYENIEEKANKLKKEIAFIKSLPSNKENKRKIKVLYNQLYNTLFVKDYVCIIIDKLQDFDRMNSKKGFYINGMKFRRLLATTGGAKKSTVVYVSDDVYDELVERIDNGRNKNKPIVPAKLEAYKSLVCSASMPVSDPDGILVVKDCETVFKANVIEIDDTKTEYPIVQPKKDYEVKLVDSDGYGLISPALSEKWAKELNEDYIPSGFCIRNSFCKGMLFTFEFKKFAQEIAKCNIVVDAWGHTRDISKVEIILTTSMLKLWDSYESLEDYLENCKKNGYTFAVTKITPKELENERNLNYQFIQSLELTDEEINQLISPTVNEINEVLGGDWRKTLLFLKGIHLKPDAFRSENIDYIKALMIDKEMIHDPFIKNKIYTMIKKRIDEAKVGVLKVRGNFSTISGDPYSLCQSIFKLPVTGLLKSGEFYSKYWNDRNVDKVACFRAPMTCHNNIRVLRLKNTDEMQKWYKYMDTVTIFNSWDTTSHALNGADRDGDTVLTTDNPIILRAIKELAPIICIQKTAEKKIAEEVDLIYANKNCFGDEIGSITNRITSMFDILSRFEKGTPEYEELIYRIQCGQNYQQNAIDKTKGIQSKSMPKEWYDFYANLSLSPEKREFNLRILADKKPYFFIYIYPHLRKKYLQHVKSYEDSCGESFRCTIEELINKDEKTNEEEQFLSDYYKYMPVSISPSIMNKICWNIESIFNEIKQNFSLSEFDYNILKTNKQYDKLTFQKIKSLYDKYKKEVQTFLQESKKRRLDDDINEMRTLFKDKFKRLAEEICNNSEELCNIVVDLCYKNNSSKQFAWDICGDQIIKNLLTRNNYTVSYPIGDTHGDIQYCGERFSMFTEVIQEVDNL